MQYQQTVNSDRPTDAGFTSDMPTHTLAQLMFPQLQHFYLLMHLFHLQPQTQRVSHKIFKMEFKMCLLNYSKDITFKNIHLADTNDNVKTDGNNI